MQPHEIPEPISRHEQRLHKSNAKTRTLSVISLIVSIIAIMLSAGSLVMILGVMQTDNTSAEPQHTPTTQPSDSSDNDENPANTSQQGEGDIDNGDYHVKIISLERSVNTLDSKSAVLLTYEITNATEDNTYMTATVEAYQNGQALSTSFPDLDDPLYEQLRQADSTGKVQPGTTLTRYEYFAIQDDVNPITIDIYGTGDAKVSQEFPLQ